MSHHRRLVGPSPCRRPPSTACAAPSKRARVHASRRATPDSSHTTTAHRLLSAPLILAAPRAPRRNAHDARATTTFLTRAASGRTNKQGLKRRPHFSRIVLCLPSTTLLQTSTTVQYRQFCTYSTERFVLIGLFLGLGDSELMPGLRPNSPPQGMVRNAFFVFREFPLSVRK